MHNTEDDCWSVLDGKVRYMRACILASGGHSDRSIGMRQVYNMTPYLRYHPGGIADLMLSAGGDCTDLFNEKHAWVNGHSMLEVRVCADLRPLSTWTDF